MSRLKQATQFSTRHLLTRKVSHKKIKKLDRLLKDPRFTRRSMIILMAKRNLPIHEIAMTTGLSKDTIKKWIRRFNELGYKGLLDKPRPGRSRKIPYDEIMVIIASGPKSFRLKMEFWTVSTLYQVLVEQYGYKYKKRYIYQLIKRLGFSLKRPRPMHYKADPEAAKKVKQEIKQTVEEGYITFYEDETRVFLTTIVKRVIAKRGEKVYMKVNVEHHRGVFVFGVIEVQTRKVRIMLSERFNSDSMMKFLYSLKREVGHGRMYIILDNASVHKAKRVKYLARRKGIHFKYLPKYSPHLNPVEEMWRQLKMYLANKLFKEIEDVKREIIKFFEKKGYKMEIEITNYFSE